jgi:hypothetical protein
MGKIAGVDVHMFLTDGCYLQYIKAYKEFNKKKN